MQNALVRKIYIYDFYHLLRIYVKCFVKNLSFLFFHNYFTLVSKIQVHFLTFF